MKHEAYDRLSTAISRYEDGSYDEQEFHASLESIILSINESVLDDIKAFLQEIESNLEYADFMVEKKLRRTEYLKHINMIKTKLF